jgi:hypothetical protein
VGRGSEPSKLLIKERVGRIREREERVVMSSGGRTAITEGYSAVLRDEVT